MHHVTFYRTIRQMNALLLSALLIVSLLNCSSEGGTTGSWYHFENNVLTVQKEQGTYLISAVAENVIKVHYSTGSSPGKVYAAVITEPISTRLEAKRNALTLRTNRVRVDIARDPVQVSIKDLVSREEIQEYPGYMTERDTTKLRFKLEEGERIYGTGSRAIPMDRRGYRFMCYNEPHYGYEYGATDLNYSIPHMISSRKYMLLIDNPARAYFDIGKSVEDVLEFGSEVGNHTYYVITGESYYDLTRSFGELTGKQPLLPLWAFGNLQSRFGYKSQRETEQIVRLMQSAGYPLDAIILDLFWFSEEPQDGRIGNLRWDRSRWPDPSGMMSKFADQGIRTITISEPFFGRESIHFDSLSARGLLATDSEGETMSIPDFFFADAGLLDVYEDEAKDWLWQQYKTQKEMGVSGWWCDLGEPEKHPDSMMHQSGSAEELHGLYGHEWTKVFHQNYLDEYIDERPLVLGRAGYAGTHRYGIVPWSGDVGRSWSGLQAQLPIMLSMGLSGLGYMHSDAGGFSMGERDAELYIRWMQFATFTPIFRPHGDANVAPPEPALWDRQVQAAIKPYIELRYRMLPYIYTMAWRNSQTGLPMARPLFYDWGWDRKTDSIENVYLWGSDMLIAPVLNAGDTTVPVYLPSGDWIDFRTHEHYAGRQAISVPVTINDLPVFVLAGSIIPTTDLVESTDDYKTDALTLTYYCDQGPNASQSMLYMDDGSTRSAHARGQYHLMEMNARQGSEELTFELRLVGRGFEGAPDERDLHFDLIGFPKDPGELLIDSTQTSYTWDTTTRVLSFDMLFRDQSDVVLKYLVEEN